MKYATILIDPPWKYRAFTGDSPAAHGAASSHYPTMTLAELKALPVADFAAKNCALCLWSTFPCLEDAQVLMKTWDFKYKTGLFTWIKFNKDGVTPFKGLGHYTRSNAEVCLLGTRGRVPRFDHSLSSVIMTVRREHSRKPDEQYERIMKLFAGPYLEMFARQQWPGWDVYGNETQKFVAAATEGEAS